LGVFFFFFFFLFFRWWVFFMEFSGFHGCSPPSGFPLSPLTSILFPKRDSTRFFPYGFSSCSVSSTM